MLLCFLLSGLFEVRVTEYLDSCPEPEPSSVNKFLKGLGRLYTRCPFSKVAAVSKADDFSVFCLFFICFLGNKMKLLQIKWDKECSGFELKDFISTLCCCGRWDCYCLNSSDTRKEGSSDIISVHVHVWELRTFDRTQTGNNIFDCIFMGPWGPATRIALQMCNLS